METRTFQGAGHKNPKCQASDILSSVGWRCLDFRRMLAFLRVSEPKPATQDVVGRGRSFGEVLGSTWRLVTEMDMFCQFTI